jgi:alkylhydroperoxidase/carboxymuconolactone decarboxylase family protein YurZ
MIGIHAPSLTRNNLKFRFEEPWPVEGLSTPIRVNGKIEAQMVDRVRKTHVTMRRNHFDREREVGGTMARLPKAYENFQKAYPKIWQAYDRLGAAVHDSGPLEKKNRELLKLTMAIGARLEGAVHSHTRRALEAGATAQEIHHVVLLGLTTLGFPQTIAALTWVEDDLKK